MLDSGINWRIFCPMRPWTLTDDRAKQWEHLFYYLELCAPLQSDRLIKTRNIVQKCAIWVKISDFIAPYDLAFWEMTLKTIGHIFDATSSFVCHFITISELKLESKTRNAQFESKLMFVLSCVTLKFNKWPWKAIGQLFHATSGFVHDFIAIVDWNWGYSPGTSNLGQYRWFLCRVTLQMILRNIKAPPPCHINLCASFHHHIWMQTGVTVRKRLNGFWPLWSYALSSDLDLLRGYHSC